MTAPAPLPDDARFAIYQMADRAARTREADPFWKGWACCSVCWWQLRLETVHCHVKPLALARLSMMDGRDFMDAMDEIVAAFTRHQCAKAKAAA